MIVAKLSHIAISPIPPTAETTTSESKESSSSTVQKHEVLSPLRPSEKAKAEAAQPWVFSSFLGTVEYSKRPNRGIKSGETNAPDWREEREEIIAQYRGPAWLVNRAWRLQASRATFGWTFRPRSFSVIPRDSAVFALATRGDTDGLKGLFSARSASPFDCDPTGWTVLHVRT